MQKQAQRFTLEQARATPLTPGDISSLLLAHGSMTLEFYAPRGADPQTPHTKDEIYVIMKGRGRFRSGEELFPFAAGDALFVPAGTKHRFEDFSEDFQTWVVFYGPEGGERS